MACAQLPRKAFLDVHNGATICPVLTDCPKPFLEQMRQAGCELFVRENGDTVVYTPDGGRGHSIESFFESFPQLYPRFDLESLDQFAPFLDEDTVHMLKDRTGPGAKKARHAAGKGLAALPQGTADELAEMKHLLGQTLTGALKSIDTHQQRYNEERRKLEAEWKEIAMERVLLDKQREALGERDQDLQQQILEVERLRSEVQASAKSIKSIKGTWFWC